MRVPCCSSMDPFEYIVYFGRLSGNQALVHHLENSNTKVKTGPVCFSFYLWQITVMSDKKFACRTNFKLYQTFCLVKIFLSDIACFVYQFHLHHKDKLTIIHWPGQGGAQSALGCKARCIIQVIHKWCSGYYSGTVFFNVDSDWMAAVNLRSINPFWPSNAIWW